MDGSTMTNHINVESEPSFDVIIFPHTYKMLVLFANPPTHHQTMECPPQSAVNNNFWG